MKQMYLDGPLKCSLEFKGVDVQIVYLYAVEVNLEGSNWQQADLYITQTLFCSGDKNLF